MEYPFYPRIKERLDAIKRTIDWLAAEMGKSVKTIYNSQQFTAISLNDIAKYSKFLEFDFMADYNTWLLANNQSTISTFAEAQEAYKKEELITIELKLTGGYKTFGLNFGDMLQVIKKEGEKFGFRIQ